MPYLGLFAAAFVAATLLPAQSEGLLAGLVVAGYVPWLLVLVASVGNVLGSTVNWFLGREVMRFADRRWFPVKPAQLARAQAWYARYGKWSLLLSWMPIIGDPLTLAAGVMREPLRVFLVLVAVAKVARYVVVAMIAAHYA
ncbi:YqaA family protein [Lysobacter panacisoli]|uniref:YqaA family protein n=1 Tax=Lysobacter panacisoli TaxID=1255263 RepID=A0ABP9LA01_9GAMM|nr:YqaA family protein [Lysobacter panacisoli]